MPNTRHGKRAEGMTVVSVPMPESLKKQLEEMATRDDRRLAAFIRNRLNEVVRRSRAAKKTAPQLKAA